jgi:3-oxoacyl-[acyl-carrier protein] reductase
MLLQNKNAIIYGGGGSLGSAVAMAFAKAGAKVFLTGRRIDTIKNVADKILAVGGRVEIAQIDALDESAIRRHIEDVSKKGGAVDISFNAVGYEVQQEVPLIEMETEAFLKPISIALQTQFLTATAAGRVMKQQGSGVILSLTATPGGIGYPYTGGFSAICCAIECFVRNLASELGCYGVRSVNMRSGGSPDSKTFKEAIDNYPIVMESVLKQMKADTMLKTLPTMEDIANLAVFLASDSAGKITGTTVDITCGTTSALNYRVPKK